MTGVTVSSNTVCLASLVFTRAVTPRFGLDLYDHDTGESSIMFNILHHRSIPADPVGIDWLKKLAVIGDRYDCMQAMYYWPNCKILAMKNKNRTGLFVNCFGQHIHLIGHSPSRASPSL